MLAEKLEENGLNPIHTGGPMVKSTKTDPEICIQRLCEAPRVTAFKWYFTHIPLQV